MKEIILNVFSGLLLLLAGYAISWCKKPNKGLDIVELCAHLIVFALLILFAIWVWFNIKRNKLAASQKFDFKFCADANHAGLEPLFKMFGQAFGSDMPPIFIDKDHPNYIPAEKFFSPKSKFMEVFRCRSIRTVQKPGKMFLQLSYLPLDKENNTLIVKRLSDNHSGQSMLGEHPELAFISFSPVPPKYNANDFSASDSYYNEVPMPWGPLKGEEPQFKELGAVLRKDKKNALYFFYVFSVKYPKISFLECRDKFPNIKYLFYENEEAYNDKLAFVKDHDTIVDIAKLNDVKEFVLNGTLPKIGKWPFSSTFWRNLHLHYTLKHTKTKEVEKCIIQNLLKDEDFI